MTIRLAERELATKFGVFREVLFYDGISESIALVKGDVSGGKELHCRIHSSCIGGHVFNSIECECAAEMAAAQQAIQKEGCGVIIYLDQEGKGNGHLALMRSIPFKKAGHSQSEAYQLVGYQADARSYRPAAAILNELGVASVILMTGNRSKAGELEELGVRVSGTVPLDLKKRNDLLG
jgi:GTP cyclohydrolase II